MALLDKLKKLLVTLAILVSACRNAPQPAVDPALLPRGQYLVENVGMCGDCHTPRNNRGELDRTRWLQGSRMDAAPSHLSPRWTNEVPGIAGLPRIGDAAVIHLLETGLMPNGQPARPPMPQLRLTHADAVAVADYLKSLRAAEK